MAYTKCKPFNVMTQVNNYYFLFKFGLAGFVKEDIVCHMAFREPKLASTSKLEVILAFVNIMLFGTQAC